MLHTEGFPDSWHCKPLIQITCRLQYTA